MHLTNALMMPKREFNLALEFYILNIIQYFYLLIRLYVLKIICCFMLRRLIFKRVVVLCKVSSDINWTSDLQIKFLFC